MWRIRTTLILWRPVRYDRAFLHILRDHQKNDLLAGNQGSVSQLTEAGNLINSYETEFLVKSKATNTMRTGDSPAVETDASLDLVEVKSEQEKPLRLGMTCRRDLRRWSGAADGSFSAIFAGRVFHAV